MMRKSEPSAAIVTPAMSCSRSTMARPILVEPVHRAGVEVGQVELQPPEHRAALPLGEHGQDVALGLRVVPRQLGDLLGERRAGVEQDEAETTSATRYVPTTTAERGHGQRSSSQATTGDMTNESSHARNRMRKIEREAAEHGRAAARPAGTRSRRCRARGTRRATSARADRCRTPARACRHALAAADRCPRRGGPRPSVAARIGRTLAAPAASVSSTTAGSAASRSRSACIGRKNSMMRSASSCFVSTQPVRAVRSPSWIV